MCTRFVEKYEKLETVVNVQEEIINLITENHIFIDILIRDNSQEQMFPGR